MGHGRGGSEDFDIDDGVHRFHWSVLGSAAIDPSGRVLLSPHGSAPQGILSHAVLGPLCAHWILMQGRIALHANCVSIGQGLAAMVGPSGTGKSSLAGALVAAGASPFSDDVVSIDPDTALVRYGACRIKLNPDVFERLGLQPLSVQEVYSGSNKLSVELPRPDDISTRPLRAIYRIVDNVSDNALRFREIEGFPAALGILTEVFRPRVARLAFGTEAMLRRCASLVGKVRLFELTRPRALDRMGEVAQAVIVHFQDHVQ